MITNLIIFLLKNCAAKIRKNSKNNKQKKENNQRYLKFILKGLQIILI